MNLHSEHITTLEVELGPVWEVGELPGGFRRVISITGGTMAGPVLNGEILPGGADWNTQRPDGTSDLWARYTVRTHDGVCIGVINAGTLVAGAAEGSVISSPTLEVPAGPYAWLGDATLIGTLRPIPGREAVQIGIHRVTTPGD